MTIPGFVMLDSERRGLPVRRRTRHPVLSKRSFRAGGPAQGRAGRTAWPCYVCGPRAGVGIGRTKTLGDPRSDWPVFLLCSCRRVKVRSFDWPRPPPARGERARNSCHSRRAPARHSQEVNLSRRSTLPLGRRI